MEERVILPLLPERDTTTLKTTMKHFIVAILMVAAMMLLVSADQDEDEGTVSPSNVHGSRGRDPS